MHHPCTWPQPRSSAPPAGQHPVERDQPPQGDATIRMQTFFQVRRLPKKGKQIKSVPQPRHASSLPRLEKDGACSAPAPGGRAAHLPAAHTPASPARLLRAKDFHGSEGGARSQAGPGCEPRGADTASRQRLRGVCTVEPAAYLSFRAATPGSTLPSSSSRDAPPPVDTWEILEATPACSAAATESPPPMMVVQPWGVRPARVLAMEMVPVANLGNSNTPMGPFHTTVLASFSASLKVLMESGPMSRPIQPSGMESMLTVLELALASNLSATTTSVGSSSCTPFFLAISSSFLASSSLSSSTREEPTLRPRAL
mmetsp:Transcript_22827/g.58112  ORF Transcript_22827/g.58112 Transcript_22827/m.58112 type:complete len:313 (-) Transcript_22827:909-1847(-)